MEAPLLEWVAGAFSGVDRDLSSSPPCPALRLILQVRTDPTVLKLLRIPFAWFSRPQAASVPLPADTQQHPELTPEAAADLAAVAVQVAARVHRVELDYTPASLDKLDALVLAFRASGSSRDSQRKALLLFGCYFGEVLVRHQGFSWDTPTATERGLSGSSFGLRAPNGGFWNPIGKLHKLAANGAEDSTAAMYRMARHAVARATPAVS